MQQYYSEKDDLSYICVKERQYQKNPSWNLEKKVQVSADKTNESAAFKLTLTGLS